MNYILKTLLKYDININLPADIPTPPEAGDFGGGGGGGDDGPPPPDPPGRPSSSASDDGGGPPASGAGRRNNGPAAGTNDWYCSSSGVLLYHKCYGFGLTFFWIAVFSESVTFLRIRILGYLPLLSGSGSISIR